MSEAEKYLEYARECVRLADHADTPETRDKLFDVARVWMDAAMTEEEAMASKRRSPKHSRSDSLDAHAGWPTDASASCE
jgi:hypothetical protein